MTTEPTGANPAGGTPDDPRVATLTTENEALKRTQSGLQRELERVRQQGGSVKGLEARLKNTEDAQVAILEAIGAIAAAGDLKDVAARVTTVVEQTRKQRATPEAPAASEQPAVKAGAEIVSAADAAGISEGQFEEAWKNDSRFVEARALWRTGSHDAAVTAFKVALAKTPAKTVTEEEIKKRVDEEVAKARRGAAPASSPGSSTVGSDRTIKASELAKLPADERQALGKDLRAALKR